MTLAAPLTPDTVERLEPVLERQLAEHRALLGLAVEHRAALTGANPATLADIIHRTGETLTRIAELEDERCRVLGVDPAAASKPTLPEIAALTAEPDRDRIARLGDSLRDLIERIRDEHASLRAASAALADHMRGLMKQVAARLSHAGTYSHTGAVDPGREQVVSGLDLKS